MIGISWYASQGFHCMLVECGDFKNKNSGLKQNYCAPGWARISAKAGSKGPVFLVSGFVRSGYVYLPGVSGATFRGAGIYGHWWSSRASSTRYDGSAIPSAYYLVFDPSAVYPSDGPSDRWYAFPLRRLSTVLDMQSKEKICSEKCFRAYLGLNMNSNITKIRRIFLFF